MPVSTKLTSAAGTLALLYDTDQDLRSYAIQQLNTIVPVFWAEISEELPRVELLADPTSKELQPADRPLASLLVSKIYYYLGIMEEAVNSALKGYSAFTLEKEGEYTETIVGTCLDLAIAHTSSGKSEPLPEQLARVVEGVLQKGTFEGGKLAIGLALALRRLDLIEMIYLSSRAPASTSAAAGKRPTHDETLLRYVLAELTGGAGGNDGLPNQVRIELLQLLVRLFLLSPEPDYASITAIYLQLDDATALGSTLASITNTAEAYQVAFDIAEAGTVGFRKVASDAFAAAGSDGDERIKEILSGAPTAKYYINFLDKNNQTDWLILKNTKDAMEDRFSIYHSAITFTNAFANSGTTHDKFLRENLEWLGRASNWAKFSTTAALGVLHKGSYVNGLRVVKPYLPGGSSPNNFSEGGALYALGLIFAGGEAGEAEMGVLKEGMKEGQDPIVQHGAALGLGLTTMASGDEAIYDEIRTALFQDNATAGEAAGYAMGLVMLGTAAEKAIDEMLSYARETQHEKIIRSLAIGLALVMYRQREGADKLIQELCDEKDAILRYGAMFMIGLAYVGTANNDAIRRLLHVAVSDVSDDVRRAAVTALGFVMYRNHTQVPRIVQLLSESYNPHVRHGATLALGISCAGTGLEAAVDMLEPMTKDPVDFVRQGAYVSLALILIQQTEVQSPKSKTVRETFAKVVADKHEDPTARFGASIAQGIIDAGGRNVTVSLTNKAGVPDLSSIVGLTLFVQFWYWFPMAHCLSLAFTPTAVVAVDTKLSLPKVEFTSHSRPSTFAYPAMTQPPAEKKATKVETAVLSTTIKANARAKTKKAAEGDAMDTVSTYNASVSDADGQDEKPSSPVAEKSEEAAAPVKEKKPTEPSSHVVVNLTRVAPAQLPYISLPSNSRYSLARPASAPKKGKKVATANDYARKPSIAVGGIVVLVDAEDAEGGEFVELKESLWTAPAPAAIAAAADVAGPQDVAMGSSEEIEEAEPPAPFEYPFGED